jgi:starvation-inducible DNA-binding protein
MIETKEKPMLFKTHNSMTEETRVKVVQLLNKILPSSIDLMLQGKQAHWNVKGPSFISLHELFDRIVEDCEDWVDEIAERAVMLGGSVDGTVEHVADKTQLDKYPASIISGKEHVKYLSAALGKFGGIVRNAIEEADRLGDPDTADLFTQISRAVDKYTWFVEAHAQSDS